jgi:hypothetical protein
MKKNAFILTLLLTVSLSLFAEHVDPETARKVATTFLNNNGAKSNQLVDLSKTAGFQNLYIFTTEESFVIIAADDCVQPILGYSTENPFGTGKMPENLFCWLEGYDEQIAYAVRNGQKATNEVDEAWRLLLTGAMPETKDAPSYLIQTQWDQNSPYNHLCPPIENPKLTGCVATAMAQIMKYYKYPTHGFGSHSYTPSAHPEYGEQFVDFGLATYDWENMIASYSGDYNTSQRDAIAKLMYHCGVSVNMNYGSNGEESGAFTSDVADALKNYFNYSQTVHYVSRASYNDTQWKNILIQELEATRPIQYCGSKIKDGRRSGHSFICDGYDNVTDKFHFNWGWGGSSDGWFFISDSGTPQVQYNLEQGAIIGIKPISYNEHPTNLVGTVSGRTVNLNWNGIESASSYNVYRNYNLIANTTSCSFNDANVSLGTHMYFVRGVQNDNVSLPSNTSTATVTFGGTTEELKIERLQATYDDGNVGLQWAAPYRLNYIDYYSFDGACYYWGPEANEPFYWGARFPASLLSSGTALTSVTTFFYTEGQYYTYIYQCTGGIPSGEPIVTVTGHYSKGWNDIHFTSTELNHEQDLWVIFKSTAIPYPLIVGEYYTDEGNYYSTNGSNWRHIIGYSFFVSANLSDGTFTYNIYDGDTKIASSLTAPNHTLSNIGLNVAHQYSVKAQKGETVAEASNMIGFTRGTASISSLKLGDKDQMTVTNSSTLTVGTLINTNPDNLILENGAQLISNSTEVMATVMKAIKGYKTIDNKGNWYLIASPMTEQLDIVNSTNLLTTNATDYDLYIFNQSNETEWLNYKQNHFTTIDNKTGYLYANKDDIDIAFVGTLNNTNGIVTIAYIDDQEHSGFNLVGNPFPCNATISRDFYRIVETLEGSKILIATDPTIAPMEGIFVKAIDTNDNSITFSKPTAKECHTSESAITMSVGHGQDGVLDIARIRFSGETNLEKLSLREGGTELFIPQNGKKYALVVNPELSETPISFKASTDGTYTLTVSTTPNSQLSPLTYLHLIDNLTGADIDLLQSQSYTFEAKADDFESRFRLLFSAVENTNSNTTDITDGVTQILDVTGRFVGTNVNENMKPGVYILRTINGNEIKTEKIIIK